jgi:hypothetical protein
VDASEFRSRDRKYFLYHKYKEIKMGKPWKEKIDKG